MPLSTRGKSMKRCSTFDTSGKCRPRMCCKPLRFGLAHKAAEIRSFEGVLLGKPYRKGISRTKTIDYSAIVRRNSWNSSQEYVRVRIRKANETMAVSSHYEQCTRFDNENICKPPWRVDVERAFAKFASIRWIRWFSAFNNFG